MNTPNLLSPLAHISKRCKNAIRAIFKKRAGHADNSVSEEEIRMMVDIGEEHGAIAQEEKEMIENVFEFNNTIASEIMVHRKDITALSVNATEKDCHDTIRKSGFSRIPVYSNSIDNIEGILNTKDYLIELLDGQKHDIAGLLRTPLFVPETIRADVLFRRMQANKQPMAILLDEFGGTAGLLTMEDLLEEIVGEIYDEYDVNVKEAKIEKISDTEFRIPGETDIDQVNETLNTNIEGEDVNTLGGFIFGKLNSIPVAKSKLELPEMNLEMIVENVHNHRIASVLVRKLPTEQPANE